jgi:DNA helicase-2/ATP-dependent DNA helicase PcrA
LRCRTSRAFSPRIDQYVAELDTRDGFTYKTSRAGKWQKGDKNPAYKTELEKMAKLKAAVQEFDRYQEEMRRAGRYDFDDMINWVIRAFEENPTLLADYQEKYLYILVDEYQDTSSNQNFLIEQLIRYWNNPNIFVVGDDDQSIFRFQGANLENMERFAKARMEDDLKQIVLTNNYRSTQPILDIAGVLISRNEERLVRKIDGLSKDLISSNGSRMHLQVQPQLKEYLSMRHEMAGIGQEISALIAGGVSPKRIAIIYRENRYGDELARILQSLQVPFYSRRRLNLLQIPFGRRVADALQRRPHPI